MSFLDHWCHFPQDDLYSLAIRATHPVIKAFTFKRAGERDSVCTPEQSPKASAVSLFSSASPRLVFREECWGQGGLTWKGE